MKKLLEEIKSRSGNKCVFTKLIIGAIKKNPELMEEIIEQTKFLDEHYKKVTLSLRTWHIWTGEGIQLCPICGEKGRLIEYEKNRFKNYNDTCSKKCSVSKTSISKVGIKRYEENKKIIKKTPNMKISLTQTTDMKKLLEEIKVNSNCKHEFSSKIRFTINEKPELLDEIIEQTKFLDEHYDEVVITQRYWHIWTGEGIQLCPICGEKGRSINYIQGRFGKYNDTCSKNCSFSKRDVSYLKNYGGNPSQNEAVKAKLKATFDKIYGCHPFKNESMKAKIKATFDERFGGYPMQNEAVKTKRDITYEEKYGGHPFKNEAVRAKRDATFIKKYGTINPMQNIDILKKSQKAAYNAKPYTLPSGEVIITQGHEHFYLDKYFANGLPESDIQHEPFNIPYIFKGKKRTYTPDLFIPSKNLIIEVKSDWSLNRRFNEAMVKRQACLDAGYNFQFVIFDRKGNEINFRESINMRKYVPKKSAPKAKAS